MEKTTTKIPIKDIVIHWAEARGDISEKHYPSLKDVQRDLSFWARSAPKDGCYDKTKFTITWEDGETYQGRIDLQFKHTTDGNIMGNWVRGYLRFLAGIERPAHYNDDQWKTHRRAFVVTGAAARAHLDKYDLGDG